MEDPKFLSNDSKQTFLQRIKDNLAKCEEFSFSVSFIKKAGLDYLSKEIEEALDRGAKGKILTSTYQNFTDIPSLETFLQWQNKYSNFTCHLEHESFGEDGFHTKGYIFKVNDKYEVVIGSSNITRFALLKNKEWDVAVVTNKNSCLCRDVFEEFDYLWNETDLLNSELISQYRAKIELAVEAWDMDVVLDDAGAVINPNFMQKRALKEIKRFRDMNVNKALVVAATGSGKTFLAAFDARNYNPKRLLFVVHKDMILEDARKTFKEVFGPSRTMGIFTGDKQELNADFIFASNQMLAKHLNLFGKLDFEYIVIDEVHHAAASTYQTIIEYFQPGFLLGLTATPDRMDGQSIYDLFGNNVPYDLRLRDALENDLIVPFDYYGIKDDLLDYGDIDDSVGVQEMIRESAKEENALFIKKQIELHRVKGTKLKAIAFCRNKEHAKLMSKVMAKVGFNTTYLTGENDINIRKKTFENLQDESHPLEIVFAIDILNEGIDVPLINMVLFLRPTESSTIFLQQLGRGLRKATGKDRLIVLDFIANSYRRSFQIALALGSLSKTGTIDKDTIKSYIKTDFTTLGLPINIVFDEFSKEEILQSIEKENFNAIKFLRQDYENFKAYLQLKPNQYPKHTDFLNDEVSADLLRYIKKYDSYYDFLVKAGQSDLPLFNQNQIDIMHILSLYLPLVRKADYLVIRYLLGSSLSESDLLSKLRNDGVEEDEAKHALALFMFKISNPNSNSTWYKNNPIVSKDNGLYRIAFDCGDETFKDWLMDLLFYGLERFDMNRHERDGDLLLYHPYTYQSSLMALKNNTLFAMTGVIYAMNQLLLFVNLDKGDVDKATLQYKDKFISNSILQWESQTGTVIGNKKYQNLISYKKPLIFVRKNKKDDGVDCPFVYLGKGTLTNPRDSGNIAKAVLFDIVLDKPVPSAYEIDFGIK